MTAAKIARRGVLWLAAISVIAGTAYWFQRAIYEGISAPVATELRITNRVGQSIALYTDPTKRTVQIPVDAIAVVPHTEGRVTVTTGSGAIWNYGSVDVPGLDMQNEAWRAHLRLTLPLTVERSGTLLLACGRRIEPVTKKAEP
jgi:hypothetical protein